MENPNKVLVRQMDLAIVEKLMRHNTALKPGSKCSFTISKLRLFASFCLALYPPELFNRPRNKSLF